MVVGCIQIEAWYLTMSEHPSYQKCIMHFWSYLCLYRGFFPFAENTGCTPSAWYQPDCGGTLKEIQSQEILHSLSINLVPFIHILMTPCTSELLHSSWLIPRSVFKHGEDIIHHNQKTINQIHHKCPLANFLASTYIFNCNVFLVYVI